MNSSDETPFGFLDTEPDKLLGAGGFCFVCLNIKVIIIIIIIELENVLLYDLRGIYKNRCFDRLPGHRAGKARGGGNYSYEESTRLAGTRLAQNISNYLDIC